MRIHSLRLTHFRGVAEREIAFPESGVVVIEGPNEIGKSSMAEAFDLLLGELDSSKKQKIKAVKPVHADEGPEIEAEIESGPYRFRYRKRFLKKPETLLTVTTPRPESLTGRTAHERVNAILAETMDIDLFNALRVQQHDPFAAADLDSAQSLKAALNRSAGQEVAGDRESTIFDRVETESLRYYTASKRPTKLLQGAETATHDAEQTLADTRERLHALQNDIDSVGDLERRLEELEQSMVQQQETAQARRAEVESLKLREVQVSKLQLESQGAEMQDKAALRAVTQRRAQTETTQRLENELGALQEKAGRGQPELSEAEQEAKAAAAARREADDAAQGARAISDLRGKDKEFQHYQRDLKHMHGRRDAIIESVKSRATAQSMLDSTRIDAALMDLLDEAHLDVQRCEAQAQTRGAQLRIEALRDLKLRLDEEQVDLAAGESRDHVVAQRLELELPGHLKIEFQGGAGSDELQAAVTTARAALASLLERAGVESIGAARTALRLRDDAERERAECDRRITEMLEDQSNLEGLVEKIENFEATAARILRERPADPPMPPNLGAAQEIHKAAKDAARAAEDAVEPARTRDEAARARWASLQEKTEKSRIDIRLARGKHESALEELKNARAERGDDVLDAEFSTMRAKAAQARTTYEEAARDLDRIHPATMRELALNAEKAADRTARDRNTTRDHLRDTRTQISVRGGEGLFEAEQDAETRLERCRRAQASLDARGRAARLLFETMRDAEAVARRAYAAPLRTRIAELGRLVFDESFEVELDESLAVDRRTLNGRTVPFDSLSVGAREQLGLITRLACALLVDPEDGVPVILDDTLGSSDPQRLEGLGAMLSLAGQQVQVIILTCTPERFRHIGDATVIRL